MDVHRPEAIFRLREKAPSNIRGVVYSRGLCFWQMRGGKGHSQLLCIKYVSRELFSAAFMSRFWQGAAFSQKGQVERRLAYFIYSSMLFLRFALPKTFTYLQHTHTTQQQNIKIQPTSSHKSVLKHAKKCPNANFIQLLRFLCVSKSSEPTGIKIDCKLNFERV